jgi:hypothetical protein
MSTLIHQGGSLEKSIEFPYLPAGVYNLQVTGNGITIDRKFLKR